MLGFAPITPAELLVVPPECLEQLLLLLAALGLVLLLLLLPLPLLFLLRRTSLLPPLLANHTDRTTLAIGFKSACASCSSVLNSSTLSRSIVKSSSFSAIVR